MLTTKYVRDHIAEIKESLQRRKSDYPIDTILSLDEEWRKMKTRLQELQTTRNKESLEISAMKKRGEEAKEKIAGLAKAKEEINRIEAEMPSYEGKLEGLLLNMPNVLDKAVPYGESEDQNVEISKWGEIRRERGKSHEEILTKLGLIDMERAAKTAGARFYYIKGDLALLELSLIRFALDTVAKKGYTVVSPPYMIRKKYYKGVTALGDFEEALYRIGEAKEVASKKDYERLEDDMFLISTSEHAMAPMHADEVFSGKELPLKYVGVSPCFRREAGAHGKDTKGIFRVHQFWKVEQFIFCKQEDSPKYFQELLGNAEEIFQKLGIPYRLLEFCTGGIGTVAARKIDIEGYMPGQGKYREVVSCSNCTDWQSLRLDIKYDDKGESKYVHTLNSTAVATTRAMVAIVENYANDDGTITVPDVLVPYMGKDRIG
jgi:seryl-tRNA synthetase